MEAPTEFNTPEWPEIHSAFIELSEDIDGMKVTIDNTDGDFFIGHETEGIPLNVFQQISTLEKIMWPLLIH